jgi:hypothetical protein
MCRDIHIRRCRKPPVFVLRKQGARKLAQSCAEMGRERGRKRTVVARGRVAGPGSAKLKDHRTARVRSAARSSTKTEKWSRPISRVLSGATIHLRCASPRTSSDLPGSTCGPHARPGSRRTRTACSPIWSCSGRGLPCHRVLPPARCALTAPFHPYRSRPRMARDLGGLLSVALSVGSRPPGVTWHLALGARTFLHACAQRLPGRLRPRCWGLRDAETSAIRSLFGPSSRQA